MPIKLEFSIFAILMLLITCYCNENPCTPNPCLNGGNCQVRNGSSVCICQPGFWGDICENSVCTPEYCNYHGNCRVNDGEAQCDCYEGFIGDQCEEELTTPVTGQPTSDTTMPSSYDCLDICIDDCPDDTIEEVDTFENIASFEDCMTFCDLVFEGICKSIVYGQQTKTCKILKAGLDFYFPECGKFGASYDTVENCLTNDNMYPDPCKKMVQSDCSFEGDEISTISSVADHEECLLASQLFNGGYYEYDSYKQTCKIYNNNERSCVTLRAPSGLSNCHE